MLLGRKVNNLVLLMSWKKKENKRRSEVVKVPLRIRIRKAGTMRQASRKYKKEMARGMACTTLWNNNKDVFLSVKKGPHTRMLKQKKIPFILTASLLFSFSHTDMPVCTVLCK